MVIHQEVLLPFPESLRSEPAATHCRGTLIIASRETLKRRMHFDQYVQHLGPEHQTTITSSVAGAWLPIAVGLAHYRACDALDLTPDEELAMGADVVHALQRTFIGTALRAASVGVGITPVLALKKFFGIYARAFRGGGAQLVRLGPKDVRVEFVGNPLASVKYFRVGFRGFLQVGCGFFARRVVAAELAQYLSATSMAYRLAWV